MNSENNIEKKCINLKIIATTDVHGAIFPYDFRNNKKVGHSLAHIHAFVREERQKTEQEVLLLDNGDILQGQPVVYYSNFEKPYEKHICAQVMNFMQYDAATIGNHDIEAGHPVYDKLISECNFPWLSANAIDIHTNKPYFQPYTILYRKNLKIAVLGLITPSVPNWLPEILYTGIEFADMIETAKYWVNYLQEKEKPDILVGLMHAGINYEFNHQNAETYKNENPVLLIAEKIPGFDIIFAGHDHQQYNRNIKNIAGKDVLVVDAESCARKIAVVHLSICYDSENKINEKEIRSELIDSEVCEPDTEFLLRFQNFIEDVKKFTSIPIGQLSESISSRDSIFGCSIFVDLIHTIQLEISQAEISLASPLVYDVEIPSGQICMKDMFNLYRFENFLYVMKFSGLEILRYLEYSYFYWFNHMRSADDHLLTFEIEQNGNEKYNGIFYNYSSAAGINYTVDVSQSYGKRVTIHGLSSGEIFDLTKFYSVAINSFRANGGGGHIPLGIGLTKEEIKTRIISVTTKDLRYYMANWIIMKKMVRPKQLNNWNIEPNDWWQQAKKRDKAIIFEKNNENYYNF